MNKAQPASFAKCRVPASVLGLTCLSVLLTPHPLWACAACYGQSDSPMAAGMNWGILSLLGMIVFVLGGVAGFFVFLARRSVKLAAQASNTLPAMSMAAQETNASADLNGLATNRLAARTGLPGVSTVVRRRPHCANPAPRIRH